MEMTKFSTIEYISDHEQNILLSKKNNYLSALSLDIVDSILTNRVIIILSQGPLNVTPLISCFFAFRSKNDILIGLPKSTFYEAYKLYTEIFFSLLYRKLINSVSSRPFFFYEDMMWCNGKINEETNELFNLDIETYPGHGNRAYKNKYERSIQDRLHRGDYNNNPKIVFVPIESSIPTGVIGKKEINFETNKFNLSKFDPKLIILESVNERKYSFDNLLQLLQKTRELGKKVVLHFSWPYLSRLDDFLSHPEIKSESKTAVFHLGKRFCLELKKEFQKPPTFALPLSLEGNLWDSVYYPDKGAWSNIKIYLPALKSYDTAFSTNKISSWDWILDIRLKNIRDYTDYEIINEQFVKNILKFPPIIDSFLSPSEIKIKSFIKDIDSWRYVSIQDFIADKIGDDSRALQSFLGLCSELEYSRDLSYEMRGLHTNSSVDKRTLLQAYIIENIQTSIEKRLDAKSGTAQKQFLILANLHPFLGTRKNIFDSLGYFFSSLIFVLKEFPIPKLVKEKDAVVLRIKHVSEIILENGVFQIPTKANIRNLLGDLTQLPVEVSFSKNNDTLEIKISVVLHCEYLELDLEKGTPDIEKKNYKGLDIYYAKIRKDGHFDEVLLSEIVAERNIYLNNLKIIVKLTSKTPFSTEESKIELQLDYLELLRIHQLSQDHISNSKLLIPGPIPFHTISDREILISQGYDSLLLPFKEKIFFAYPGRNFQYLLKQIQLYKDLFSEKPTTISNTDLLFSLDHIPKSKRIKMPPKPDLKEIPYESMAEEDTIIDAALREKLMDESNSDEDEKKEIITLKEIWSRAGKRKHSLAGEYRREPLETQPISRELVNLKVRFEDGKEEIISFPRGTLIRKKYGAEYILSPIEETGENEIIFYIQTSERESVDNFLLRDFAIEQGISMEQILEPFTCLKLFYEILYSIRVDETYDPNITRALYWLNETQKEVLFKTIQLLLKKDNLADLSELMDTRNIWYGIKSEELTEIFSRGINKITYGKLYGIAQKLGITITKDYFKSLSSSAINEQKHYYFKEEKDLLAIGRLIGHQNIMDSYQAINEMGKKARTILQIIGRCISRVAGGKGDSLNEMDLSIEGKLQKCQVVSISFP